MPPKLDPQISPESFKKFRQLKIDFDKLAQLEISDKLIEESLKSITNPGKQKKAIKTVKQEAPNKPILFVFRHGQSVDNQDRVFSGWHDSDLTPEGISQAKILSKKLVHKQIDRAYTSSLIRAKKTLKLVLKHHPKTKVIVDDRITERDYGDLVGLNKQELFFYNPKLCAALRRSYDFPPPGGESLKQVETRVCDFLKDIIKLMKLKQINVAVSCHGNSMRVIRFIMEKLTINQMLTLENPLGQDYCSYSID